MPDSKNKKIKYSSDFQGDSDEEFIEKFDATLKHHVELPSSNRSHQSTTDFIILGLEELAKRNLETHVSEANEIRSATLTAVCNAYKYHYQESADDIVEKFFSDKHSLTEQESQKIKISITDAFIDNPMWVNTDDLDNVFKKYDYNQNDIDLLFEKCFKLSNIHLIAINNIHNQKLLERYNVSTAKLTQRLTQQIIKLLTSKSIDPWRLEKQVDMLLLIKSKPEWTWFTDVIHSAEIAQASSEFLKEKGGILKESLPHLHSNIADLFDLPYSKKN